MSSVLARIKAEPAVVIALIGSLFSLATAFGFHLSAEQTAAVMGFATLVVGFVTRSQVTPAVTPPAP